MDRTGLRPTTDGSAGSDKTANDYMKETYPKQQQSVPHPAPEPPQPETPKPSKPSSTPSHIKHYNPDHNEFEPAYTVEDSKDETENTTGFTEEVLANIIEDVAADTTSAGTKNYIEKQIKHSDDVLPNNVVKTALKNVDELFAFGGAFIDFASQIVEGKDAGYAVAMTGVHMAVDWAFVSAAMAVSPATIVFIIGIALASSVNIVIDNYLDPYFER